MGFSMQPRLCWPGFVVRSRWRLLLAAVATALTVLLGLGTAYAQTAAVAETRVGASTATGQVAVGVHEHIAAGQRWGNAPPQAVTAVATGVAAKSAEESVTLYRHVSPAELADIGENGFRAGPNSLGGKWFTESSDHAQQWGAWLNPEGGSVVRTQVPRSFADKLRREGGKYDGIGPARYVDQSQLADFNRLARWDVP